MTRLLGIYMERDFYQSHEITGKHIDALRTLGINLTMYRDGSVKINEDTSGQLHELCDVERGMVRIARVDM